MRFARPVVKRALCCHHQKQSIRSVNVQAVVDLAFSIGSICAVSMVAMPLLAQNQLIYMPTQRYDFQPRDVGLEHEDIWLKCSDDTSIHCWLVADSSKCCSTNSPIIINLHGNAGNISHRLNGAKNLIRAVGGGCRVLLVGYRGYGQSEGEPHESGLQLDAQAALDYAVSLNPSKRVFVLGESLGGAVGIHLAANNRSEQGLAGIILENTFASIQEMVREHYPLLWPITFIEPLLWNKWKSIDIIDRVSVPVLFLSGRKDEIVPSMQHARLAEKTRDCSFVSFESGMHNDLSLQPGYYEHISSFIHVNGGGGGGPGTSPADHHGGSKKMPGVGHASAQHQHPRRTGN
jgi:pimeloyl-ACP methyl ester carboxylesterase